MNILRVKHRVLNGGHNVPKEDIVRRFYRSRKLFWKVYKDLVDEWIIYYNSDEYFEIVATKDIIYDEEKFNEFKENL